MVKISEKSKELLKPNNFWGKTPYRGVTQVKGAYQVAVNGKYVGLYKTPVEAAKAYDAKAFEVFGVNAKMNFPVEHITLETVSQKE